MIKAKQTKQIHESKNCQRNKKNSENFPIFRKNVIMDCVEIQNLRTQKVVYNKKSFKRVSNLK